MPIKIQKTGTLVDVESEILEFENEYQMSSEEFLAHQSLHEVISEFDAIEWSFLLMQKRALIEDKCSPRAFFTGPTVTKVDTPEPADIYKIAA